MWHPCCVCHGLQAFNSFQFVPGRSYHCFSSKKPDSAHLKSILKLCRADGFSRKKKKNKSFNLKSHQILLPCKVDLLFTHPNTWTQSLCLKIPKFHFKMKYKPIIQMSS